VFKIDILCTGPQNLNPDPLKALYFYRKGFAILKLDLCYKMEPRIEDIASKKLVGKHLQMSLSNDKTYDLWRSFMPERKGIMQIIGPNLICMQVYDHSMRQNNFKPDTLFEKWAAVEVSEFKEIPEGMETYNLAGGLYAVFNYKGTPDMFAGTAQYIFGTWLPQSGYELDTREHFEVLGEKYRNNDPDSEEEIWVPIKIKQG
jgi:AraC family transcriptional regulator